jgi:subtilisin family serine protease
MNVIVSFYGKSEPDIIKLHGGSVVDELTGIPNLLIADIPDSALNSIKNGKNIKSVSNSTTGWDRALGLEELPPVGEKYAFSTQLIRCKDFWDRGIKGRGVKVGIMDRGISYHISLKNVVGGVDFLNPSNPNPRQIAIGVADHGTRVASCIGSSPFSYSNPNYKYIAGGVAPDIELYSIKCMGSTTDDEVQSSPTTWISAINWAIENKLDVLVCSYSINISESLEPMQSAVQTAFDNNIALFCPTGNDGGVSNNDWEKTAAVMVGGVELVGNRYTLHPNSEYSSYTKFVASYYTEVAKGGLTEANSEYMSDLGTSFCAPAVAGVYALYKQVYPNKTAQEIIDIMINSTKQFDGNSRGWNQYYGYGTPQPNADILKLPRLATSVEYLDII